MVLCGVVGGKRECPAKHRKMNVLSLLQPTGRDSGCSLLTPFGGSLGCHPPSAKGFFHTSMDRDVLFSAGLQQLCTPSPDWKWEFFHQPTHWLTLWAFPLLPPWAWLKPQPPCPGFSTMPPMPVGTRLIPSLKHGPSFTFHIFSLPQLCLCHSVYEFSPSEETLGEWWPSAEALHQLCYHVLPTGIHIIRYKLTSII